MKTKLFTLLLAVAASVGTMFAESGTWGNDFSWNLTDGVLTISGTGAMPLPQEGEPLSWPWHKNGFDGLSVIKKVVINNGVTSIGDYSFYGCDQLISVTLPNTITSIGLLSFGWCINLTSIDLPISLRNIGGDAFAWCNLENILIPASVNTIDIGAFTGHYLFDKQAKIEDTPEYWPIFDDNGKVQYVIKSITCNRSTPPNIENKEELLCGYPTGDIAFPYAATILYVPAWSIDVYKAHEVWGLFDVRPITATATETSGVKTMATANSVDVVWPSISGAATYDIVIRDKAGNVVCTLVFNAQGQLISIAFNAPSRDGAPQQTQTAGFAFTVTGLEAGTSYDLTITAKDSNGTNLDTQTVSFTTDGTQGINDINAATKSQKIVRDGQVLILRGEKTYTITGQEIK